MTTVVFIHGLTNMPEADNLRMIWDTALSREISGNPGLDLGAHGVDIRMVYWSDVLYPEPAKNQTGAESSAVSLEASNALEGASPSLTDVSASWIEAVSKELNLDVDLLLKNNDEAVLSNIDVGAAAAEAIPLPWLLKKPLMKAFVRDSHHYFFNVEHSPRPGITYRVRDEIRARFVRELKAAKNNRPIIVFSHSMGTFIAYDCLKNVSACPQIDHLMTVGSPLGMSEVQDKLDPGYSKHNGYPAEKVSGSWVNVFDPVDIVSRADPWLKDDFKKNGKEFVSDLKQNNGGAWTHGMVKYASQPQLRNALREMLT